MMSNEKLANEIYALNNGFGRRFADFQKLDGEFNVNPVYDRFVKTTRCYTAGTD